MVAFDQLWIEQSFECRLVVQFRARLGDAPQRVVVADHYLHPCLGASRAHLRTFNTVASVATTDLFPASSVVPLDDFCGPLFQTYQAKVCTGAEVTWIRAVRGLVLVVEEHGMAELGAHCLDGAAGVA